jgi:pimeloyl-ACP methyl ester carboxylesterase
MTTVLVHGNPETEAIWDDLVPHLRNDGVVRLSPPGFGSAIPPGFDVLLMLIATGLPANS